MTTMRHSHPCLLLTRTSTREITTQNYPQRNERGRQGMSLKDCHRGPPKPGSSTGSRRRGREKGTQSRRREPKQTPKPSAVTAAEESPGGRQSQREAGPQPHRP